MSIDTLFSLCKIELEISKKGGEIMNKKQTSKRVASKASKALTDGRSSRRTKSIAGSALSQTRK